MSAAGCKFGRAARGVQIDADLYHIAARFSLRPQLVEVLNDCRTNRGRIADGQPIRLCSPPDFDTLSKSSLPLAKSACPRRSAPDASAQSARTPKRPFVNLHLCNRSAPVGRTPHRPISVPPWLRQNPARPKIRQRRLPPFRRAYAGRHGKERRHAPLRPARARLRCRGFRP